MSNSASLRIASNLSSDFASIFLDIDIDVNDTRGIDQVIVRGSRIGISIDPEGHEAWAHEDANGNSIHRLVSDSELEHWCQLGGCSRKSLTQNLETISQFIRLSLEGH